MPSTQPNSTEDAMEGADISANNVTSDVETIDDQVSGVTAAAGTILALAHSLGDGQMCGLDMEQTTAYLESKLSQTSDVFFLDTLPVDASCQASEHFTFIKALEDFHSCAGWDLKEMVETLPSALVGSTITCANMAVSGNNTKHSASEMKHCIDSILGDNAFGEALRGFYLHPDMSCPCLQAFSDTIPACKLDVWPIPFVGSWLKTSTCLVIGLGCNSFEDFCVRELQVLNKCLPTVTETKSCAGPLHCEEAALSFSLSVPPPLVGIPLPDSCLRIYREDKDGFFNGTEVIHRYEKFRQRCGSNLELWDIQHHPIDKAGQGGFALEIEGRYSSSPETSSSETASSSLIPVPDLNFFVGLATGLGCVLIAAILKVIFSRLLGKGASKRGDSGKYKPVKFDDEETSGLIA